MNGRERAKKEKRREDGSFDSLKMHHGNESPHLRLRADMMVRQIGFGEFEKSWEGPVYLEFTRHSGHTRTVRYKSQLSKRTFDLYAPLFMLKGLRTDEIPERLIAAIGKGQERLNEIGFAAAPYRPRIDSEVCEFAFADEKVNSIRYDMAAQGQVYGLYVPKEVFAGEPPPRLLYLRLGVPAA